MKKRKAALMTALLCLAAGAALGQESQEVPSRPYDRPISPRVSDAEYNEDYQDYQASNQESETVEDFCESNSDHLSLDNYDMADRQWAGQLARRLWLSEGYEIETALDLYWQVDWSAVHALGMLRSGGSGPSDGYFSVDYSRFTPILIKTVKAQQGVIDRQQAEIDDPNQSLRNLKVLVRSMAQSNSNTSTQSAELASAGIQE